MSEQEKKNNNQESMLSLRPKTSQIFFVYHIQSKEKMLYKKELFKEKE